jgi:protease-4
MSDNEKPSQSPNSQELSQLKEVITLLKQQVDSTKANEDQLLRTVKYTGETNSKIMEVMTSQNKHNKIKLILFTLPVLFILISFGMKAYNESSKYDSDDGYVAQVKITGTIAVGSKTASAEAFIPSLRAVFADEKAKGILIRINSPGGSPTQLTWSTYFGQPS